MGCGQSVESNELKLDSVDYQHKIYPVCSKQQSDAMAFMFDGPDKPPRPYYFKFPKLIDNEVKIKQKFFSISYTDCAITNNQFFSTIYPIVPGHQIVGEIEEIGPDVKNLKVGDKVGIGYMRNSCLNCQECKEGKEQYCTGLNQQQKYLYYYKFGGFATHIQTNQTWVFKLPQKIDFSKTAPLLSSGVAIYSPLKQFAKKDRNMAVAGIGGIGHLAIKMGKAFGMNVTAISSNSDKENDAKELGADHFILSTNQDKIKQNAQKFDLLFVCNRNINGPEINKYSSMLIKGGKMILLTIPCSNTNIQINFFDIVANQKQIRGSLSGSIKQMNDMLQFCSQNSVYPTIQKFQFIDFEKAYKHLQKGHPKYKCVVEVPDNYKQ